MKRTNLSSFIGLAAVAVFLVIGCKNFEYTHSICPDANLVDIELVGNGDFSEMTNGIRIFGEPSGLDVGYRSFSIQRKSKGIYQENKEAFPFRICKLGNRTLVEQIKDNRRNIFEYNQLPDGFLLTALRVPLDNLVNSGLPFQKVESDTIVANAKGDLEINLKLAKNTKDAGKSLLVDTSDPAIAAKFAALLVPSSDAKRFYSGTR